MYTKIVEVPNLSLNGENTVCVCPPLTLTLNEYPPPPFPLKNFHCDATLCLDLIG